MSNEKKAALIKLLTQHLDQTDQDTPKFVGEYPAIEALPELDYPCLFYWFDTSRENAIRLSFNIQRLTKIITRQAMLAGIEPNAPLVADVLNLFQGIAERAFRTAIEKAAAEKAAEESATGA